MLLGIRPDDATFVASDGAVFHPQDEADNLNIAHWEITSETDSIDFDIRENAIALDHPVLSLATLFGPTDFTLLDRVSGDPVITELSGFDTNTWMVDVQGTSGQFRLTDFDTDAGVDGTQAAWYPYIRVEDLRT